MAAPKTRNNRAEVWARTLTGTWGFSSPGAGAVLGGLVDFKANGAVSAVGYNKSLAQSSSEIGIKYLFGGAGPLANGLINPVRKAFEPSLLPQLTVVAVINLAGKEANKAATEQISPSNTK